MERENFQVDLRGIVQILSHHLYSSPRVYLRELIQNARDAIHARGLLDPAAPGEVEIVVDEGARVLEVRDTGIGLTADEMRTLLATIGASSKRNEFEAARADFLGQFGIGLLSCFLVAEEIEVVSRSARTPDAPTMRWIGNSNGTYAVAEAPAEDRLEAPGSRVRLVARSDDAEWIGYSRVSLLAERFASLLDLPIRLRRAGVDGPGELISRRPKPWDSTEDQAARWCEQEFGFAPIAQLPIRVELAGVTGVAFIGQDRGRVGSRTGDAVFCRGMFVADDNTQLAPPWANFVRLGIECGELAPTASRESLQDSELLRRVRDEVGEQIQRGIERLAEEDPDAFSRMIDVHGEAMSAMAVTDDAMLDFVIERMLWETTDGRLTLDQIGRSGRDVDYVTHVGDFAALGPVISASGKLLVNGGYSYGREILDRVADRWKTRQVRVRRLSFDEVLERLGAPGAGETDLAAAVRRVAEGRLRAAGLETDVRSFAPETIPVLFVPGSSVLAPVEDDPWAALMGELGSPGSMSDAPRLVLNLASPAVRALGTTMSTSRSDAAVDMLRMLGLLLARENLTENDTTRLAAAVATLIPETTEDAR